MRALSLIALVALSGCAMRSRTTTYVNPDAYGAVEGTGIEARDVRTVAHQMATELMGSPALAAFHGTPRIAVLPVENRSRFLIDQEIFTTLITDTLIQNAGGRMAVLDRNSAQAIERERAMKRTGTTDTGGGEMAALAGADFFLVGRVQSLSASSGAAQSDYTVVRFELTNAETSIISWSNSYQMKKEGTWGVMYQ